MDTFIHSILGMGLCVILTIIQRSYEGIAGYTKTRDKSEERMGLELGWRLYRDHVAATDMIYKGNENKSEKRLTWRS
jgi:hypothetical protein